MPDSEPQGKTCFIICPIASDDSPVRVRSNNIRDFIITPALMQCGYDTPPLRADVLPNPGRITRQIIELLIKADLVVADLTDHNPNVFYELAIRHASRKPVVQIMHKKDKLPFDVANQRTIFFDHEDLRSAHQAMEDIVKQIRAAEADPDDVDTPLSDALLFSGLRESTDPVAKSNAEILDALLGIQSRLENLERRPNQASSAQINFLRNFLDGLNGETSYTPRIFPSAQSQNPTEVSSSDRPPTKWILKKNAPLLSKAEAEAQAMLDDMNAGSDTVA